jgi:exopolyphosphatase/guanosine-5'-triphosphate,3'-diphosphate pyrophosphatase
VSLPPEAAQGRLDHGPAVAVIDIGSNSVRLVVYEGQTRSPTPIFNEKVLAGLGRQVQSTGLLAADAVTEALMALRRFRALCDNLQVGRVLGIATAACRDAKNGPAFIAEAERICRIKIDVLSGRREAELAALGVVSGIYQPDGIAGDLGGGSLELIDVRGSNIRRGVTVPLGGLALKDTANQSLKRADKIAEKELSDVPFLRPAKGAPFTPSAARGVRWQVCTWRKPATRSMSCTVTHCRHARRSNSAIWFSGSIPKRCRISKWCRQRAVRCWVTPRWFSAG